MSSSTRNTASTSEGIKQILEIGPIVFVRDGLEPWSYLYYDKAVTLGDDGWVYKWEEPIQRWFVTSGHAFVTSGHATTYGSENFDKVSPIRGVYRRDKIDLKRIEAARWKLLNYMPKVVAKTRAAAHALAKLDEPYYVKDGHRVRLSVSSSHYRSDEGFDVREETEEKPEGIVEQIALLPVIDDPAYEGGTRWKMLSDWSGAWWNEGARLNQIFEKVAMDLIHRKLGEKFRRDRFSPRVVLQINGRHYTFESPNTTKAAHTSWPHPSDIQIDVDTMKPLKNMFHQAGRQFDAPLKKPKRRRSASST